MIGYFKNKEIDRELWDNCIRSSVTTKPYPYSWYLDIMSPGWEALVDDDYDSVFPVPSYVKFGVQYAATPAFIQQLGAFSPDKSASNAIIEFLDFMPDIYKLTDLCIGQKVEYSGYKVTEKSNFELSLSSDYEKLWGRYTPECRKYITGAEKKRYEITGNVSPEELVDLCIENKRSNIEGVRLRDYDSLVNLMHHCIEGNKGRIAAVKAAKKRLVYGLFLVELPGSITIVLESNTPRSIEKRISYYVINEIIKEYTSTGAVLDFAGLSDKSIATGGKAFGALNIPYYRIYRNRLFWPVRIMK